ncbi:MAG: hypothetical protein R2712_16815 [Vicinamibacterales bacterium]
MLDRSFQIADEELGFVVTGLRLVTASTRLTATGWVTGRPSILPRPDPREA